MMLSLALAPLTSSDSGSPPRSTARCSLDPGLARSAGGRGAPGPRAWISGWPLALVDLVEVGVGGVFERLQEVLLN